MKRTDLEEARGQLQYAMNGIDKMLDDGVELHVVKGAIASMKKALNILEDLEAPSRWVCKCGTGYICPLPRH